MTEKELINHYQEQLKASGEKAPEGLWDNIARKMDINDIWSNIDQELTRQQKASAMMFFFNRAAVIAGFLVLGTIGLWTLNNSNRQQNQAPDATSTVATAKIPEHSENQEALQPKEEDSPGAAIARLEQVQGLRLATLGEAAIADTAKPLPADRFLLAGLMQPAGARIHIASPPTLHQAGMKTNQTIDYPINEAFQIVDGSTPSFSFGLTTALKNTWLFNHETFQSFRGASGSRTALKIYPDIALSMKYALSTRWDIETGLSFSSNTGQSYQQYLYGRYDQKDIVLNYFHAELSAVHKSKKRWFVGSYIIGHSTTLGVYVASLNSATEKIGGIKEDVAHSYRGNDYGMILGHNLELTLSNRLVLSPGMRLTWGLPNIYTGAYDIPSLKRTHNQSIELRFSLYYNLFK
ncbi:MAG: hypothetical protein R6U64_01620 [Bacteroidales bacterium]